MRGVVARTRHVLSDLLYERRYRTRTTEKLTLDTHDAENICYSPVGWRQLPRVLPPDSVTERDVFVDLGSGKGRAVLEAAATYPFARVIGVELVPELHEVVALARAGEIEIEIEQIALEDAVEGYRRMRDGEVVGRAVAVP